MEEVRSHIKTVMYGCTTLVALPVNVGALTVPVGVPALTAVVVPVALPVFPVVFVPSVELESFVKAMFVLAPPVVASRNSVMTWV